MRLVQTIDAGGQDVASAAQGALLADLLLRIAVLLAIGGSSHALRAALPYAIVDTGQVKCYDNRGEIAPPQPGQPFYGQDAQHPGPGCNTRTMATARSATSSRESLPSWFSSHLSSAVGHGGRVSLEPASPPGDQEAM